jgi:meiotically up-regulated gene 157 (Mug157) protein
MSKLSVTDLTDSSTQQAAPVTRRSLLRSTLAISAAAALPASLAQAKTQDNAAPAPAALSAQQPTPALHQRPAPADRRFTSPAVEDAIVQVQKQITDPTLALIFGNCLPNTLDMTVTPGTYGGKPDTFVITGDIDAMWLRDSSAQVWPYLPFCNRDPHLSSLLEGVIRRHTRCILLDPYANAFLPSASSKPLSWAVHDDTTMKPGVGERKWEIDSLCYTLRLAHGYWRATGNTAPFDADWQQAARAILRTFREQQRLHSPGPYHFQRDSPVPSESQMLSGFGNPARPVGLIHSGFRPSDDACIFPLFIPANLFARTTLRQLAELADKGCHDTDLAQQAHALAEELTTALARYAEIDTTEYGRIWAYEVDGFGNSLRMDDANAPGLLSLAYLGCVAPADEALYRRSRAFALSTANPYFFKGSAGQGIGGPHEGLGYIWPMSILFRAFSSNNPQETLDCLRLLRNTTDGTHFMHESFWKDDPARYTRPWFAWANTLFGELILKLAAERPQLLRASFL